MTTRERNIYPIAPGQAARLFALVATMLMLTAPSALAQCEGVAGAGDEYCETLPEAGGERSAGGPGRAEGAGGGGGVPRDTARALERAGAGAVRQIGGPTRDGGKQAQGASAPAPEGVGGDSSTALPYILAALTLLLLLLALARYRRGSTSPPPGPAA